VRDIKTLLEKITNYDKDERYMATVDLGTLLSRSPPPDAATERRIVTAIRSRLDDPSNDVQSVAVKTLSGLFCRLHVSLIEDVAERLARDVSSGNADLRDVYAIGLRGLVRDCSESCGETVVRTTLTPLLQGLRQGGDDFLRGACCDVLADLIERFGKLPMIAEHAGDISDVCLSVSLGTSSEEAVVRRAGAVLSKLSVCLDTNSLQELIARLSTGLEGASEESGVRNAAVRTMCGIGRAVGHRLGGDTGKVVPIFLTFCNPNDIDVRMDESDDSGSEDGSHGNTQAMDELRESCFVGFESFIQHCPEETSPHLPDILASVLAYLKYDPNYFYDEDSGMEDGEDQSAEDDSAIEDDEDGYDAFSSASFDDDDDDDDTSWKVRRAALRCLLCLIKSERASTLEMLWEEYSIGKALLSRFKEREENVRVDVMACFTSLLCRTIDAAKSSEKEMENVMTDEDENINNKLMQYIQTSLPVIVKCCGRHLSDKRARERTLSSSLEVLRTLATGKTSDGPDGWVEQVMPSLLNMLKNEGGKHNTKSTKLDTIRLCRVLLERGGDGVAKRLDGLLPLLCDAVGEDWYKIIAEALRTLKAVPRLLLFHTPPDAAPTRSALMLYAAISPRLAAHDIDQEIKECALGAAGELVCTLHSHLDETARDQVLNLLSDRLKNETTRLRTLQTFGKVAAAEPPVDLGVVLHDVCGEIAGMLRQQNQNLRLVALEVANVLVKGHGKKIGVEVIEQMLMECGNVISGADLHISHLALQVSISVLQVSSDSFTVAIQNYILPRALVLSASPLLHGATLISLLAFFSTYTVSHSEDSSQSIVPSLKSCLTVNASGSQISKVVVANIAKCLAVTAAANPRSCRLFVQNHMVIICDSDNYKHGIECQLALLTLGELGQLVDLHAIDPNIQKTIIACLDSKNEENKGAAAYALGRAAAGNIEAFLPVILDVLYVEHPNHYLILTSLKEMLSSESMVGQQLTNTIKLETILKPLFKFVTVEKKSVRAMCAECLGALACLDVEGRYVLEFLVEQVQAQMGKEGDGNIRTCWTIASAVKFVITYSKSLDKVAEVMPTFLGLLNEKDLSVRAIALQMVYAAIHHSPAIISSLMKELVLPSLYTLVQFSSIRVVDLGPFKHKEDDGLPLRKTALAIFATAFDHCPNSLVVSEFMPYLAKALGDVEDIQLQAHQIVCSMCIRNPGAIVPFAESFVEPLKKTVNKKVKDDGAERIQEWIKSGLRATLALSHLDGIMTCQAFSTFFKDTQKNTSLFNFFAQLKEER